MRKTVARILGTTRVRSSRTWRRTDNLYRFVVCPVSDALNNAVDALSLKDDVERSIGRETVSSRETRTMEYLQ